MLCCLLAALMSGNLAAAGGIGWRMIVRRSRAGLVALGGLAVVSAVAAPFAIAHAQHYAERAAINHRSVLEEILAQPLCTGQPHEAGPKELAP